MGIIPKSEVRQIQLKGENFQCGSVQQIYGTLLQHSTKVLNKQERKDSPVWLKEMSSITLHTICRTMLLAMMLKTTAGIQTSTVCCLGPSLHTDALICLITLPLAITQKQELSACR